MKRDGQSVFVAFPSRLMSTARSPASMGAEYGRDVLNMYATADGAGSKRNGVVPVGGVISGVEIVGVFSHMKSGVGLQLLAVGNDGAIYLRDGESWQQVWSGLNPAGVPRAVVFAGKLVLVNGLDPMLAWDGDTWQVVEEKVVDVAGGLAYVSANQFQIASLAEFYPVGSEVEARIGGGTLVQSEVAAVSVSGSVVTVTLADAVLGPGLDQVAYTARPPVMAYVYAAHDRLWGFGKGPLTGSELSADVDRARVYHTHGVNDETAWRDSEGIVPGINLADKSSGSDMLMAMAVKDGLTIFLLRNSTQVWTGSTPGAEGDFAWQKTIPLGTVHGSLVVELPNDVAFVTQNGVRTFSRTLQTEQLDVSDVGSEVDPTVAEQLRLLVADDACYRRVNSVVCAAQNWFGARLYDHFLMFQVGAAGKGWAVFDGAFGMAGAFHAAPDGRLYLAVGGQVFRYDETVWDDDGEAIATRWWTPWLRLAKNGKRWANRYVEVVAAPGAVMDVVVRRYRNLDDGDGWAMTVPVGNAPDYWDSADWDASYFDNATPSPSIVRDRFVSDEMAFAVESANEEGPLTLFGVKVFGVAEK